VMIIRRTSCLLNGLCPELQLASEKGELDESFYARCCNNCKHFTEVKIIQEHLRQVGIDVTGDAFENNLNYLQNLLKMKQSNPLAVVPKVDSAAQEIASKLLGGKDVKDLPAINDKIQIIEGLLKQAGLCEFTNVEAIAVLLSMFLASKDKA